VQETNFDFKRERGIFRDGIGVVQLKVLLILAPNQQLMPQIKLPMNLINRGFHVHFKQEQCLLSIPK
jgi:hypothetical protein